MSVEAGLKTSYSNVRRSFLISDVVTVLFLFAPIAVLGVGFFLNNKNTKITGFVLALVIYGLAGYAVIQGRMIRQHRQKMIEQQQIAPSNTKLTAQTAKPWTASLGAYTIQLPLIPHNASTLSSSDNFRYHRLEADNHDLWIVGEHLVIDGWWYGVIDSGSVISIDGTKVTINDSIGIRKELPATLSKWIERCVYPAVDHNGFFVSVSPDVQIDDVIVSPNESKYTSRMGDRQIEITKSGIFTDGEYQQLSPGDRIIIEKIEVIICGVNTNLVEETEADPSDTNLSAK